MEMQSITLECWFLVTFRLGAAWVLIICNLVIGRQCCTSRAKVKCTVLSRTQSAKALCLSYILTVVSNAWLETLLSAIDALPKETIRQEVATSAVLTLCRRNQLRVWIQSWAVVDYLCRFWVLCYQNISCLSLFQRVWPAVASLERLLESLSHQCEFLGTLW